MKFDLIRPCPHCPFRLDNDPFIRPERAEEIARSIARGSDFACHETTELIDEGDDSSTLMATAESQMCAGAMIAMYRHDDPNQIMRIAERFNAFDPSKLDMSAPIGSLMEFVDHHREEEFEPCDVVSCDCLAPAGWMEGGTVVSAASGEPTTSCANCGAYVCENCAGQCCDSPE